MTTAGRIELQAHIAVHIPGCAARHREGVSMPSGVGPFIECLADTVAQVTVIAHDVPPTSATWEDLADFVARPERDNIDVVSLGPKGTWRGHVERRNRIRRIVSEASTDWDIAMFRLPNRRVGPVYEANRCPRVVSFVLGYAPDVVRALPPGPKKVLQWANTIRMEPKTRAIIRGSEIVLVNSKRLGHVYRALAPDAVLQPWSMRRDRYSFRAEDRLDPAAPRFLVCGRITPTKGVFEAAEAFARIKGTLLPSARLEIVGTGDAVDELQRRVHDLGIEEATTFHGWIPAGPRLFGVFSHMDVLLHPSYVESFPFVVWEAMAHSVLVVCTDVGGLGDFLEDGRDALFTPPLAVDPIVSAVERLLSDEQLRRSMLTHASERASYSSLEHVCNDLVGRIGARWPEMASIEQR
jgi:glycosyltransferase involved in cell wall biosynthesis